MNAAFAQAQAVLAKANKVLVITGAGISADCGISTFREDGGQFWRGHHYSEVLNPNTFAQDPMLTWSWHLNLRQQLADTRPSPGHIAIAQWAKASGKDVKILTQNIDGLHELAGNQGVRDIHGSVWRNKCTQCAHLRDDKTVDYTSPPTCPICGGIERPDVVWFGESVDNDLWGIALLDMYMSHAILLIGTSCAVQPMASLIQGSAVTLKKTIIEINPHPVPIGTIVLPTLAKDSLPQLLAA